MPDYLTIIIAVVFGFLLRHAVLTERRMFAARWWVKTHQPRRCPSCGSWHQARHMKSAQHKAAGWTLICESCYANAYTPFKDRKP